MAAYHKYLKNWTSERGITSYLGSDKKAFQRDWLEEKRETVRFGEEMGREAEAPARKKDPTTNDLVKEGLKREREQRKKDDANKLKPMNEKIREASIEYKDYVRNTVGRNTNNERDHANKRASLAKMWNLPEDWYDSQLYPHQKPTAKVPINIPKMWVFKPTKDNYGSTEVERRYLLNALPRDRAIAREGLYKNSQAEDFTVGDFKDAIDKTKKPETSPLLRIAKFLQKNDFGKIVYYK